MPPVHRQGRDARPRDQRERKKALPQDVAQRLEARDGLPDPIEPTVRANQVERKRTWLGHGAKLENGTEGRDFQRTSPPQFPPERGPATLPPRLFRLFP